MEWLKYTALALASFLIVFGLLTLAMTWLAPRAHACAAVVIMSPPLDELARKTERWK